MRDGRIVEQGTPREVYARPRDAFTAAFMGVCNVLEGTVQDVRDDVATIRSPLGALSAPCDRDLAAGAAVDVYLHPESLALRSDRPEGAAWRGVVDVVVYRGEHTDYEVQTGQQVVKVRTYRGSKLFQIGDEVWVAPLDGAALLVRKDAIAVGVPTATARV
jgi:ABC-type Fe3+/spermidine/putrescine transport system ATPase subunit